MSYIQELADQIKAEASPAEAAPELWLSYALVALTAARHYRPATNEDVHDAWAAHAAATRPDHKSIVPFADLHRDVQNLDAVYTQAINKVIGANPPGEIENQLSLLTGATDAA